MQGAGNEGLTERENLELRSRRYKRRRASGFA